MSLPTTCRRPHHLAPGVSEHQSCSGGLLGPTATPRRCWGLCSGCRGCPGPSGLPAGVCPRCHPAPQSQAARTLSLSSGKPLQTSARRPRGSEGPPLASSLSSEAELGTSPGGTRTAGPDPRVRLAVVLALLADRAPREAGTGLHTGPAMGAAAGGLRRRQEPSPSKAGDARSPGLPGSGVGAAALCGPGTAGPGHPHAALPLPRGGQGRVCELEGTEQLPWG